MTTILLQVRQLEKTVECLNEGKMGEMGRQSSAIEAVFGTGTRSSLHFSGIVTNCSACGLPAVENLAAAIESALAAPLDFPSIEKAIVPGDRVVLAVDPAIPQMPDVIAGVVAYLLRHEVQANQLAIVLAGHEPDDSAGIEKALSSVSETTISVELHDADDSTRVAYVAANQEANPIYVNRTLVDAEVVIPISCARGGGSLDYLGPYTVFPRLSDRKTRGRFFSLARLENPLEREKLRAWADEAAWWTGLYVAIQVIPGYDGEVAAVLAGNPSLLEETVQRRMEAAWRTCVPESAELVMALIDGGRSQQTWDNVARAIHAARKITMRGGSIVVCTQLVREPGRALLRLSNGDRSSSSLVKQLSNDPSDDALAASVILQAVGDCHVYLYSEIASETIEALGMGAIESLGQLDHLLQQHPTLVVLGSTQHRLVAALEADYAENQSHDLQNSAEKAANLK